MNVRSTRLGLLMVCLFLSCSFLFAQKQSKLDVALRYVEQQHEDWNLTKADISNMLVSDEFETKHNGVTHLVLKQTHQDIPVHNALVGVHVLPNGEVFYATNGFVADLAKYALVTMPQIDPSTAIFAAAKHLNIPTDKLPELKNRISSKHFLFEKGGISNSDIPVNLIYYPVFDDFERLKTVKLVWEIAINMVDNADYWALQIDASTGEFVNKNNYTQYCTFDHAPTADSNCKATHFSAVESLQLETNMLADATYNVFPVPFQSPVHGPRSLEVNPHDPVASPYGWHDTDGMEGAEFTITRGNNVHAYQDTLNRNTSQNDEPDGGEDLIFDFPYDPLKEPKEQIDAAVVQLFYMNNMLHDISYSYGFDEAAGNFQQNNYGKGGNGGDYVNAHALDGSGINNANFGTPPDGSNPTMQMYLWNQSGRFTVNEPSNVAGIYETRDANFGADITDEPVMGDMVVMNDGSSDPTYGCVQTDQDLTGKIALIDRGGCEFGTKVLQAENAGAIGAIICNFDGGAFVGMAAGADGGQVSIPSVMVNFSDCQRFRGFAGQDLIVSLVNPEREGPDNLDASFDNGIIAHEYGHGISNRLTAGASETSCLSNDEQMGEGWSDFITLMTSVKSEADRDQPIGVGAFIRQQGPNGTGIRRYPYSIDRSVNNQVYDDIIGVTGPHGLGEIWASMLWDLYWAMSDEHGFDADLANGTGGNNMAVQLVFDGMKLQGCNPGFIAGRDGILAADRANNGGANQCLIWNVFASRGLGFNARGGSSNNRNDNLGGYETRPDCISELKIVKSATELINAGENVVFNIIVTNDKTDTATNVMVTDELPDGLNMLESSTAVEQQNGMLIFELGDIPAGESVTINYSAVSDTAKYSLLQFKDDMESGDDLWDLDAIEGSDIWDLTTDKANSGETSWFVKVVNTESDQVLQLAEPIFIEGEQPVMRFYHQWETEWGYDGGFVQASFNGTDWFTLQKEQFFKNPYENRLSYATLAIPDLPAFAGVQTEFIPSYVDLSEYKGEDLYIRFRFATEDEEGEDTPGTGWYVDDVVFMDMFNYNTEACVTSDENDQACSKAAERGTIVEPQVGAPSSTDEILEGDKMQVYPNPAASFINVVLNDITDREVNFRMMSLDGKLVWERTKAVNLLIRLDIAQLANGFYLLEMQTSEGILTKKVVVE